jgi:hypothetical protein
VIDLRTQPPTVRALADGLTLAQLQAADRLRAAGA